MSEKEWDVYATAFQMLARGLTCPDAATCEAIGDGSFAAEVGDLLDSGVLSSLDGQAIRAELESLDSAVDEPDILSTLRRDYTRLFSAPQGAAVPVWETLFLDPGRTDEDFGAILIRSKAAVDAQHRYETAGMGLVSPESADHMRIECEFAGYLCAQIGRAAEDDARSAWVDHLDGFVSTHFDRWYAPFFSTLATHAEQSLYRAIAMLGQSMDIDRLKA